MAYRQGSHMSGKIAKTIQTYYDFVDAFSKSKNCFDHNFPKSKNLAPIQVFLNSV